MGACFRKKAWRPNKTGNAMRKQNVNHFGLWVNMGKHRSQSGRPWRQKHENTEVAWAVRPGPGLSHWSQANCLSVSCG